MKQQTTLNLKTKSKTNSLLELSKLFFAFIVLKAHGLTPIDKNLPWLSTAAVTVEFFFVVMGWFLIRGINRHQENNEHLGLWKSWWLFFKKRALTYIVPCLIPGLITNTLTLYFDGGIPNGLLWMYWFIHDAFVVMFIYYIIFYKIKDKQKRLIILICIFVISYAGKFVLTNYFDGKVIIYDFPRALSCISFGMLCSKIPTPKENKALAWIVFSIIISLEITLVVLPTQMIFGNDKSIYKDMVNIVLFPLLIWSCLWVNFSSNALNYVGKWSKGLYMWQMVPYTIMAICKFYGMNVTDKWFGWMCMVITIGLTILEDPIRKIITKIKNKPQHLSTQTLRKEKFRQFYWKKSTQIVLATIALLLLLVGAAMGIYGLIDGIIHKNGFNLFINPITKRNTFYCDTIVLLIGYSLLIGIFPINYFLTNKNNILKSK